MSDINRTNNTNTSSEHTDDPLAELARIVSGDTSHNASQQNSGAGVAADNDDFGLDMETELLRELEGSSQAATPIKEASFEDQLLNELDLGDDISEVEEKPKIDTPDTGSFSMDNELEIQLQADLKAADSAVSGEPFIPSSQPKLSNEPQAVKESFAEHNVNELTEIFSEPALVTQPTDSNLDLEFPIEAPQEEASTLDEIENNELDDIFAQGFAEELAEEDLMPASIAPQVEDLGEVFAQSISDIEQGEQVQVTETYSDPLADLALQPPEGQFEQSPFENVDTSVQAPFGAPKNIEPIPEASNEVSSEPQYDLDRLFSKEADLGSTTPQSEPVPYSAPNTAFDAAFADPGSLAEEHIEQPDENHTSNDAKRGGLKLALGALGVALLAGVGIVAWGAYNDGNVSNDANVPVIEAEQTPTKVKPQDPGGKKIANTENKVYENVTGNGIVATTQDKLINSRQEPLNLEVATADQKNISRLKPTSQSATKNNLGGVSPKRVRTLTIKPDGSIVRSAPAKTGVAIAKPALTVVPSAPSISQKPVEPKVVVKKAVKQVVKVATKRPVTKTVTRNVEKVAALRSTASAPTRLTKSITAPVARPTINKPINIATNTVAPATRQASIPTGGYTVQVSSQRSDKAARASYANIKKRFSSVLGNRQAIIQKGVVKGKGTFYRAKVPTRTKAEATKLCASLKRAGGSCFVSR